MIFLFFVLALAQLVCSVPIEAGPFYCIDSTGLVSLCGGTPAQEFADHPEFVAHARFVNRINHTGWAELDIESHRNHEDHVQAYFSGLLEGFLTSHLVDSFRENVQLGKWGDRSNVFCKNFSSFIDDNLDWMKEQIVHKSDDIYWQQVGLVLHQVAGLDDGYWLAKGQKPEAPIKPHRKLNPCGSLLLNLWAEVGDLAAIINPGSQVRGMDHCSALIKWLPEKGEVYVSQNTWTMYSMMLRVLKKYTLNFRTSEAKSVALSSYPGAVVSFDDFYVTSKELVVQETSIANFRQENYHGLNARNMVFEFIRNTIANRLAATGREWGRWFARHNSGTYNNQFMVVDYKRLKHDGTHLEEGFLEIVEQMPNLILAEDRTQHLLEHTYWASYNIPAFKAIYEYSGTEDQFKKYGDHYSYEKTPRARIFARDHSKVKNLTSMYHLMRYNDFQHDPISVEPKLCDKLEPNGVYAIAARGDLNDPNGNCQLWELNQHMLGAIDAKITSASLIKRLEFVAVSGPTDQQESVFDWTKVSQRNQIPHIDQPNVWHFKPVRTRWMREDSLDEQQSVEFEEFQFDL